MVRFWFASGSVRFVNFSTGDTVHVYIYTIYYYTVFQVLCCTCTGMYNFVFIIIFNFLNFYIFISTYTCVRIFIYLFIYLCIFLLVIIMANSKCEKIRTT